LQAAGVFFFIFLVGYMLTSLKTKLTLKVFFPYIRRRYSLVESKRKNKENIFFNSSCDKRAIELINSFSGLAAPQQALKKR
jgi:hypothetical protein